MENDSKKELERLKRKLSAMNKETNDLLVDIPIELLDSTPPEPEEAEVPAPEELPEEPIPDISADMEAEILAARGETTKMLRRENRWLVGLMLLASLLCVGIIGMLIYWLEVFLK